MMEKMLLTAATICTLLGIACAHVSLTYPIPRAINYDFLDNFRTEQPCGGQPKGTPLSELREGDNITVTWHLGYPHRGGYKIELLPENDNVSEAVRLFPTEDGKEFGGEEDTTSISQRVTLPSGRTCENCTIRLVRQALEWGKNYIFWTCGDVRIIGEASQKCSGKGNFTNGLCICEKLYNGDRCQYWDECEEDADCSSKGKCVDTYAVSNPKKQCFCNPGYFGEGCKKVSTVKTLDGLDLTQHRISTMSDRFTLYHKVISSVEIEMVLKVKTTTWAGIGWKPTGPMSCRSLDGVAEPESEGKTPEPEAEGTTAEPEPTIEAESKPTVEPEQTTEPEPKTTAEPEQTTEPQSETTSEPKAEGEGIVIMSEPKYLISQGLNPSLVNYTCSPGSGGTEPEAEPSGEPETKSETTAEPETKGEAKAEGEGEPESEKLGSHPMDCTDMVIVAAQGKNSRVHDAFARDRSTPKFDTFYGDENSLTAAIAEEKNGETIALFRRKLEASDSRDHTITDSLMSVIWAQGQEHLRYNHAPLTGLEQCNIKDIFFYRKDVLMYHGHKGNRGAASINFITAPETGANRFKVNEETYVTWSHDTSADAIIFQLHAPLSAGRWVALGISADKKMPSTDVLHVAFNPAGQPVATDRFASGYTLPTADAKTEMFETRYVSGKMMATFSRPLDPTKLGTDDISVDKCRHLIIATGDGYIDGRFSKHDTSPSISEDPFCFRKDKSSPGAVPVASVLLSAIGLLAHVLLR